MMLTCMIIFHIGVNFPSGVPKGGMGGGGSGPSTIEKDGPQDFTKNAIKSVPQGGLGRSSKILKSLRDI